MTSLAVNGLNQTRAGHRLVCAWFLEIDPVWIVSVCVGVCVCVFVSCVCMCVCPEDINN